MHGIQEYYGPQNQLKMKPKNKEMVKANNQERSWKIQTWENALMKYNKRRRRCRRPPPLVESEPVSGRLGHQYKPNRTTTNQTKQQQTKQQQTSDNPTMHTKSI